MAPLLDERARRLWAAAESAACRCRWLEMQDFTFEGVQDGSVTFAHGAKRGSPVAPRVLVSVPPLIPRRSRPARRPACAVPCSFTFKSSAFGGLNLSRLRVRSLRCGARTRSPSRRWLCGRGFRSSISLLPATQAPGLLAIALAGFPPAERASLRWTHEKSVMSLLKTWTTCPCLRKPLADYFWRGTTDCGPRARVMRERDGPLLPGIVRNRTGVRTSPDVPVESGAAAASSLRRWCSVRAPGWH